ncbi:bifunctional uridylyltransferase/uridylyl-removing enzyme [Methylopila jiangsuensis]|uniref:Bifunctional uridylyltransferase/uridylyl-removing enzyme n=1 Tax=Methylopila jiangsuensis TaxID=586230 RepID=A0A9W6JCJ6_9HYPH|nr:[protein-PII] uridylyltransferase [Methylopila jiangsuensis]MDR6287279.1 [protein-PII] uridylyltransferase [Methylopila jiangsuensis]GLK74762.1 bifunctional uridylyltransferase/uridylyl-removing enzyme [Methylopila jiangsuensis]
MSALRPPARAAREARELCDETALAADFAAISAARRGDGATRHAEVVARVKRALAEGRALARTWLLEDKGGALCAERLSGLMDAVIRALFHHATTDLYPRQNPSSGERLSVAAVGGYGRGAMAPGSDVDLLFLLPYKQTAWGESVVEAMLYVLWDAGLKVGHATRSVDECIRLSKADMTIRTAVLEARFVVGDEAIFADKMRRFDAEVVEGAAAEFAAAKLAERDERLGRSGASRYLVEPNVKEGKGGLRDLNTLFWIAKYVYRVRDIEELVRVGLFSAAELKLFRKCEDFLWAVRCHLHYITGRAEDRLSFDLQREIALALGYTEHPGLKDVERFMKHYFLVAKDVGDLTAILCHALEERQQKPKPRLDRFLTKLKPKRKPKELGDFMVESDRLDVVDETVFAKDPVNLIRFFHIADRNDLALHPDAVRLVTKSLKLIDARLRESPEANALFIEILTSRRTPETTLRRMNETGVLGRFIPDFGKIVAMMQFNMYHHYTVDEHLLRSIGVLAEIEGGEAKDSHPLASETMPTVRDRVALYVALFLHDIAKGRPEDHSVAGGRIARRLCPRFGLSASQTETVAWLIEQHLTMSIVAQSRDLSDRRTIADFAKVVQSPERLKLLLILTICDIKAVGPGVWNGWKGQLLRTLYFETENVLTGGRSDGDRNRQVERAQSDVRERLSDWSDRAFKAYAKRQYPAYWLREDADRAVAHARFIAAADKQDRKLATDVATDAFRGVTELTVLAPDHPRLLAIIAGACAAGGANIVDAHIHTTTDGFALDSIVISRAFPQDDDELRRGRRIAESIEKALIGDIWLHDIVESKVASGQKGRSRAFHVEPEVTVTNAWSDRHTVLELVGLDRPGLLYELTTAISKLNLNIVSAHVATFGERAVDVFYVTDLTGAKLASTARQNAVRRSLKAALSEDRDAEKDSKARPKK